MLFDNARFSDTRGKVKTELFENDGIRTFPCLTCLELNSKMLDSSTTDSNNERDRYDKFIVSLLM